MKRWISGICIVLVIALSAGCGNNSPQKTNEVDKENNQTTNQSDEEKSEMTEQQEEIFRSYGLSEDEIDRMKKEGLDYKEQSFVDTAILMLDYLEEKYGEKFKVAGGDIPGFLSDEYWITAKAIEGEHAGEKFDVYYKGENEFTDGYIILLKKEEACEALKELIENKFDNVQVFSDLAGDYGSELLTPDSTGDEMLNIVEYVFDLVITDPDMSEAEFTDLSKEVEKFLNDHDIFFSGTAICLNKPVDFDSTDAITEFLKSESSQSAVRWFYDLWSR